MCSQLDATSIARVSLHDPAHVDIQESQTRHRLVLLQHWNIPSGTKVLELGCGQGDCTTVLASAVGEQGGVVAVDPADLDYGESYHLLYPTACPGGAEENTVYKCLLQVPHLPSARHRVTSHKAPWESGLLGSNNPRWTTSPPFHRQLPAEIRSLMQQSSPIPYGTFPRLSSSFPLSVPSNSIASVSSLLSGRWLRLTPPPSLTY